MPLTQGRTGRPDLGLPRRLRPVGRRRRRHHRPPRPRPPDLPDLPDDGSTTNVAACPEDTVNPITVGTLNLLGAGHTDGKPGGGGEKPGYETWDKRLPGAMRTIENAGVTIAGLQEVHGPQATALAERYAAKWGMYPATGKAQNRVIWDRNEWEQTDARLVDIPYFGGKDVGMPLVQLTGAADSPNAGQVIWVWSIHNPANTHGDAAAHRKEALRRQLATMTDLAGTGTPAVILGDFNDGKDGQNASHCVLTPELSNAFGGSAEPCKVPKKDAPIDHVYGANLTWANASVDNSTQTSKIADHPLVVATTAGSSAGCAVATETNYNLGPVKPQLTQLVNVLGPMFDIKTVGGYRESATDPNGHPAGLAADFMILLNRKPAQGDRLAAYAKAHASELGIDYIIWYQRIWSVARASEGWRPMEDRGSDDREPPRPRPHQRQARRLPCSPWASTERPATRSSTRCRHSTSGPTSTTGTRPAPTGPAGTPGPTSPLPAGPPSTPPTPAPSRSTPPRAGPARSWSRSPPEPGH